MHYSALKGAAWSFAPAPLEYSSTSPMEVFLPKAPSRLGRFFAATFRILILTALFAAIGMGFGLFFGILGTILYGAVKHMHVDMAMAYRDVAIPLAGISALGAFVYNTMTTLRRAMRRPTA